MSRRWHMERLKDHYYREAKRLGFRSRAAFKLIEIIKRYKVIKEGDVVLDLGAYPGGWLQVASKAVGSKGLVVGVDLKPIEKLNLPNVITLVSDVCDQALYEKLLNVLPREIDVLLSDLSPSLSGVWSTDIAKHMSLIECALSIASRFLRSGGTAIIKAFQSEELNDLVRRLQETFNEVRLFKPRASKAKSREIYLICLGFKKC